MSYPTLFRNLSVSPNAGDFFIETLEFHHSAFSSPERIVNQDKAYVLTLEATAPVEPSVPVTFTACPFDIKRPKKGDKGHQTITIVIPNVDRRLTGQMDRARAVGGPITCYWRTYSYSQQNAPILNPPPRFEIKIGQINVFEVQLQATFFDFLNEQFPRKRYTSSFAPGLTR